MCNPTDKHDDTCNTRNTSNTATHPEGMDFPVMSREVIGQILAAPIPFTSVEDDDDDNANEATIICQRMVLALSPEEQQAAACTSYAYWYASLHLEDLATKEAQLKMAMREARRHWVAADKMEDAAMERFQYACRYRMEHHLDLFRTLYPIPAVSSLEEDASESQTPRSLQCTPPDPFVVVDIQSTMRAQLEEELSLDKQPFFVRGCTRDKSAVAVKLGRASPETCHASYVTTQLYVAERAMACTEWLSRGVQEKVVAVFDFESYSRANAPPLWTLKETVQLLQALYPERLQTAVITEPAFWMKAIYNLVYPLLGYDTRDKIQMAYGDGKHELMSALLEADQAMPFMRPDGQLPSEFDPNVFLQQVPFHCLYQ